MPHTACGKQLNAAISYLLPVLCSLLSAVCSLLPANEVALEPKLVANEPTNGPRLQWGDNSLTTQQSTAQYGAGAQGDSCEPVRSKPRHKNEGNSLAM